MSEVTISYKGAAIAALDAAGTKTLLTAGKYCEGDLTVAYDKPTVKRTVTAVAADAWYIEFSVPGIGDWRFLELTRSGEEDGSSGTRKCIADRTLGIAAATYVTNTGSSSIQGASSPVFTDTQPAAMSVMQTYWTKQDSIVVFRAVGNANYAVGKTYELTLHY